MSSHSIVRPLRFLSLLVGLTTSIAPAWLAAQLSIDNLQYQVGDRARETIYAPDTIHVKDPGKHPDVFAEVRNTTPPLYGYRKSSSQEVIRNLTRSWNNTRDSYLSSLDRVFGKHTFRLAETSSTSFQTLIQSFQARNKGFPVTDDLARRWASGDKANDRLERMVNQLSAFMTAYFIRADEEPEIAKTTLDRVDLITVGTRDPLAFEEVKGHPMAQITVRQFLKESQARQIFLRQIRLPSQEIKTHIARFIKPNTHFLETLSIERWVDSQKMLSSEIVFEKGSVVVRQGEEITPLIKEVLDNIIVSLRYARLKDAVQIELARENPSGVVEEAPVKPEQPEEAQPAPIEKKTPAEPEKKRPQGKLPPPLAPTTVAQTDSTPISAKASGTGQQPIPSANSSNGTFVSNSLNTVLTSMDWIYRWLIGLGIIGLISLMVFLHLRKKSSVYRPDEGQLAVKEEDKRASIIKELTSNLLQTLFRQRQTLLKNKENATAQVAAMENRLAKLQPEIFDKLKAYEDKIKNLEKQLEQQNIHMESLDEPLDMEDDEVGDHWGSVSATVTEEVSRPQFQSTSSGKGKNHDPVPDKPQTNAQETVSEEDSEDKSVPFPSQAHSKDLEEEAPPDLMEEVLEDLEAEDTFEKRIAKGLKP